ncbi:hypothetical protein BJ085DRAFT_37784 [Dimargaris cristalligena]|uniref:BHLH domain-containing protein n=1 Tax=Dimargaris cristalligena TaxID=215637 RepID=A0A4P9ZLJ1_9FUNG|nr:hypothetical protein BJ085DRAFT_37784 [Dimargaris cristalligena]|eukprot:RKP34003.1 hypothetical protein BJ085DRAFT_37784 [Dimargaris cristalligena]
MDMASLQSTGHDNPSASRSRGPYGNGLHDADSQDHPHHLMNPLDFAFTPSFLDRSEFQTYSDIVDAICQSNLVGLPGSAPLSSPETAHLLYDPSSLGNSASSPLSGLGYTDHSGTVPTSMPTSADFNFMLTPTTPGFQTSMNDLLMSPGHDGSFPMFGSSAAAEPHTSLFGSTLSPLALASLSGAGGPSLMHPAVSMGSALGGVSAATDAVTAKLIQQKLLHDLVQSAVHLPTTTTSAPLGQMHQSPEALVIPHDPSASTKRPSADTVDPAEPKLAAKKPKKQAIKPAPPTNSAAKRSRKRQVPPSPPLSPPDATSPKGSSVSPPPSSHRPPHGMNPVWNLKSLSPARPAIASNSSTPPAPTASLAPIPISPALDTGASSNNSKIAISRVHSPGAVGPPIVPRSPEGTISGPPVKNQRRIAHNAIERRYRNNINDRIRELKDSIPALLHAQQVKDEENQTGMSFTSSLDAGPAPRESKTIRNAKGLPKEVDGIAPASKLNKATILRKATEYVWHLRRANDRMRREQDQLRQLVLQNVPDAAALLESLGNQAQTEADAYIRQLQSGSCMGDLDDEEDEEEAAEELHRVDSSPVTESTTSSAGPVPEADTDMTSAVGNHSDSDSSSSSPVTTPTRSGGGGSSSGGGGFPARAVMGVFLCASFFDGPGPSNEESGQHRALSALPFVGSWSQHVGHVVSAHNLFMGVRIFVFLSCLLGLLFYDDWFGGSQKSQKNRQYWRARYGTRPAVSETTTSTPTDPADSATALSQQGSERTTGSATAAGTNRPRTRAQVSKTAVAVSHSHLMNSVAEINNTPLPRSYRSMALRIFGEVVRLVAPSACLPERHGQELSLTWLRLSELQLFHEDVSLPSLMKVYAWLRSFSLGSVTPNYPVARAWLTAALHVHKSLGIRYVRNMVARRVWNWAVTAARTAPLPAPGSRDDSSPAHLAIGRNNHWQWLLHEPAAADFYLDGEWKPFTRSSAFTVEWPRIQLVLANPVDPLMTLSHLFVLNRTRHYTDQFIRTGEGHRALTALLDRLPQLTSGSTANVGLPTTRGTNQPWLLHWYINLALVVMHHKRGDAVERDLCLQRALDLARTIIQLHSTGVTGLSAPERKHAQLVLETAYLSVLPAILVQAGRYDAAQRTCAVVAAMRTQRQHLEAHFLDQLYGGAPDSCVDSSLASVVAHQSRGVAFSSLLGTLCTSLDSMSGGNGPSTATVPSSTMPTAPTSPNGRSQMQRPLVFSPATTSVPIGGSSVTQRRPADSRAIRILYQYTSDIERQLEFLVGNLIMDAQYQCWLATGNNPPSSLRDAGRIGLTNFDGGGGGFRASVHLHRCSDRSQLPFLKHFGDQ